MKTWIIGAAATALVSVAQIDTASAGFGIYLGFGNPFYGAQPTYAAPAYPAPPVVYPQAAPVYQPTTTFYGPTTYVPTAPVIQPAYPVGGAARVRYRYRPATGRMVYRYHGPAW